MEKGIGHGNGKETLFEILVLKIGVARGKEIGQDNNFEVRIKIRIGKRLAFEGFESDNILLALRNAMHKALRQFYPDLKLPDIDIHDLTILNIKDIDFIIDLLKRHFEEAI